jgi:GNAT superfamily N-acetyltransferase
MSIACVPCTRDYWEFVRRLRNDPRTKHGFIQQGEITQEQHQLFMLKHGSSYLIALKDGEPVGFAGSVNGDIRVCVDPDQQRQGIGKALIHELLRCFPGSVAKVKTENAASRRLFAACGFLPTFVVYEFHGY